MRLPSQLSLNVSSLYLSLNLMLYMLRKRGHALTSMGIQHCMVLSRWVLIRV